MRFRPLAILASLFGFGAPKPSDTVVLKPRSVGHSTAIPLSCFPPPCYPYIPGIRASADSRAWGMSEACRRMRRKNRLRAAGVAGQRR